MNYIKYIITVLAGILLLTSCEKDKEIVKYRIYPELHLAGTATTQSGLNNVDLKLMLADDASRYLYHWQGPLFAGDLLITTSKESSEQDYFMPLQDGESDLTKTTCSLGFSGDAVNKWLLTEKGYYSIDIDVTDVDEPSINIEILEEGVIYPSLYLMGSAISAENIRDAVAMISDGSGYVFTWNGALFPGDLSFSTLKGEGLENCDYLMPVLDEEADLSKTTAQLVEAAAKDFSWEITSLTSGMYEITIDLSDLSSPQVSFEKTEDIIAYNQLYIFGSATSVGDIITDAIPMDVSPENSQVYTWTGEMNYGDFKIVTSPAGGADYFIPLENFEGDYSIRGCQLDVGGALGYAWGVNAPVEYTISIDISNLSTPLITITQNMEYTYTGLYGIGESFDWNSVALTEDPENPGVFTWEGDLLYSDNNKLFKFTVDDPVFSGWVNWDKVYYVNPTHVDFNDYSELVEPGVYPLRITSELRSNLVDYYWGIPSGENGNYRLTVNMNKLEMTVEKL
jgi:hypothetical protein